MIKAEEMRTNGRLEPEFNDLQTVRKRLGMDEAHQTETYAFEKSVYKSYQQDQMSPFKVPEFVK